MSNSLCVNDDMLELFRLIRERNALARVRFCKRLARNRVSKIIQCKQKGTIKGKHVKTPMNELKTRLSLLDKEYNMACRELAIFTKNNKPLRLEMRRKFNTKQHKSASNTIDYISLEFLGSTITFSREQIDKIVVDSEINDILLGLPQI